MKFIIKTETVVRYEKDWEIEAESERDAKDKAETMAEDMDNFVIWNHNGAESSIVDVEVVEEA